MAKVRAGSGVNQPQNAQESSIDPQEVARIAYGLYEQRGRADGQALDDWLKAEVIILEDRQRKTR